MALPSPESSGLGRDMMKLNSLRLCSSTDAALSPKGLFPAYLSPIKIVGSYRPEAFSLGEMLAQQEIWLTDKELKAAAAKCLKREQMRYMMPGSTPCLVTEGLSPDAVAELLSNVAADQLEQTPADFTAKVADLLAGLRDPSMYGFKPDCHAHEVRPRAALPQLEYRVPAVMTTEQAMPSLGPRLQLGHSAPKQPAQVVVIAVGFLDIVSPKRLTELWTIAAGHLLPGNSSKPLSRCCSLP